MNEHPDRLRFRELCIDTLMRFPTMASYGNYYNINGTDPYNGSDCSSHICGMRNILGWGSGQSLSQQMYNECVRGGRPSVRMLGCFYLYGSSTSHITHVTLGWDDLVAIGANNGTASTKTRAQAKARSAGWQFCDPDYRSDLRGVYVPDWWPWIRVTTAALNLRAQPTLLGDILDTLDENTVVELITDERYQMDNLNWMRVTVDGETGWVASEYLKR